MFAAQTPWIYLDARLHLFIHLEPAVNLLPEPKNFLWRQESRSAAPEMKLHDFPVRIQNSRHLIQLLRDVIEINAALPLVLCDDGVTAAIPAERLAERHMKVEREIARLFIIRDQFLGQLRPGDLVRKLRGRRVRGVARSGDVVFPDE